MWIGGFSSVCYRCPSKIQVEESNYLLARNWDFISKEDWTNDKVLAINSICYRINKLEN